MGAADQGDANGKSEGDRLGDGLGGVFEDEDPSRISPTPPKVVQLPPGTPPEMAAAVARAMAARSTSKVGPSQSKEAGADGDEEESLPEAEPDRLALMGLAGDKPPRDWSRLPRMVVLALKLVWRAARWRGGGVAILQALAGLGLGAQLLAGNQLLTRALTVREAGEDLRVLIPAGLTVGVIGATLAVLSAVATAQQRVISELVSTHAYRELMSAAAAAELADFENPEFYNRLQRTAAGGQIRPFQLVNGVLTLVSSLLGTIGLGVALFAIEPLLVPLAAVAAVPTWIAITRNARGSFIMVTGNTPDDRERSYLRTLLTERDPAKEVRSFNLVGYLRKRHDIVSARILDRIRDEAVRNLRRTLAGNAGSGAATVAAGAAVLWLLVTGRLPIAGALTAALAMQQLRGRVTAAGVSVGGVFESSLYLEDYASFVSAVRPPSEVPTTEVTPFRRLVAREVSFSYPGSSRPALQDIDVEVHAGEVVALVGENGSGKTTLAKLLCGLYSPSSGLVSWDDDDLADLEQAAVREHITVIFQDFIRYALPARDNVGLGRHQNIGNDDEIARAIRLAGLDSVFERLPNGWETVLGRQFSGGQDLSGGQWQRVALARAFFRDAAFLVLDEPTAALDARAENRLFQRLRELAAGRAVLLITHRFGNVRMADRIYVLHHGQVVEHGTHDELIRMDGRYAELFNLQAAQLLQQPTPSSPASAPRPS